MSEQHWVKLESYRTVWAAHLARLHLGQADIEAEIRHEQLATLSGAVPFAEAEVELWVRHDDLERAAGVISEHDVDDLQPDMIVVCPSCEASSPAEFGRCWKCDANGVWERVEHFATDGVKVGVALDDDENGIDERYHRLSPSGKVVRESLDADQDGRTDRIIEHYPDGSRGIWTDENGDHLYERREIRSASDRLMFVEVDGWSRGFKRTE